MPRWEAPTIERGQRKRVGRKRHLMVLGLDVCALVEELIDEAELAVAGCTVEGGPAILWWGRVGGWGGVGARANSRRRDCCVVAGLSGEV
jgi:hypothetical protein